LYPKPKKLNEMKAIIPVAGAGTRLRPFTYTQPKALIPVAGKPIISYIIDDLLAVGIKDFVFIVGYLGDKIVDFVNENYPDIEANFVYQTQREGLGQAIYLTREYVQDDEEIVILLGDSLIEIDPSFFEENTTSSIAIKKVNDPQNFGLVELNDKGTISKFVEKPNFPFSNLAMVGLYRIKETALFMSILEKLNKDDIRTNGEIQLTDALELMIKEQITFKPFFVTNWLDVGKGDVLLQSNAILLKKYNTFIEKTATIENSVIIDPVYIAGNAMIKNAIVGPNVTIGENTEVCNSIIDNGIIGSYSKLKTIQLTQFVIGSDSSLKGSLKSLTVGDNTDIDFSFDR